MRKTIEKETKTVAKEVKTEFTLTEAFVLWRNQAKSGAFYLSGNTSEEAGNMKLVGYFNTNKKNPKEPDVRVYSIDNEGKQDKEVCSLWENVSKNGETRYLTGLTDDKEKIVAFYGDKHKEARPYIRAYFQQD